MTSLEYELDRLKDATTSMITKNITVEKEYNELLKKTLDRTNELTNTKKELIRTQEQLIDMQEKYIDTSKDLLDTKEKLLSVTKELVDRTNELTDTKKELISSQTGLIDMQNKYIDASKELLDTKEKLLSVTKELVDSTNKVCSIIVQNNKLENENNQMNDILQKTIDQQHEVDNELSNKINEIEYLKKKNEEIKRNMINGTL